jgi:hypothetical protein
MSKWQMANGQMANEQMANGQMGQFRDSRSFKLELGAEQQLTCHRSDSASVY